MTYLKKIAAACALAASFAAGSAAAAPILLDFEGVGDYAYIKNFYHGGTSSAGFSGTNYGVTFSYNALGLADTDAGGSGLLSGMPSGSAVMTFFEGDAAFVNLASGFDTRVGFHYASDAPGSVAVYDGLDGTGNLLASLNLAGNINDDNCPDFENLFCRFDAIELLFGGTARSVVFGGVTGSLAVDDVSLGALAVEPPADVPEPATLALSALGLAGLAAARRKSVKK